MLDDTQFGKNLSIVQIVGTKKGSGRNTPLFYALLIVIVHGLRFFLFMVTENCLP